MYYLLIQCWSFKVFAIPDLSQHVKSSNAFFSKLRKWTYHICVLNPRYIYISQSPTVSPTTTFAALNFDSFNILPRIGGSVIRGLLNPRPSEPSDYWEFLNDPAAGADAEKINGSCPGKYSI